jgi:hypothetical protein
MPPSDLAPLIIGVAITLAVAGVLILRPLTKRLGDLIEATARDRRLQVKDEALQRLTHVVGQLADRIEHLEERQDFAEQVLASHEQPRSEPRARLSEPPDL